MVCFSMVMRRHEAGGLGFGFGTSSESIDDGMQEFISSEITRGIIDANSMIFGSIKEGIMELMEDRLKAFKSDMATSLSGAHTLSS